MARKPRIHFNGAFYHVLARGNAGQEIFLDSQDYQNYLDILEQCKERFPFILYAYVLMSNHLHFLIEVSDNPLSRIMQNLQFRYTQSFNRRHKRYGHLFQGRYKAILCEKDEYFLELSAYIHLNPVRALIVDNPEDYQWSSYNSYMGSSKVHLVDTEFLLSQFSGRRETAVSGYSSFVKRHISQGHQSKYYELQDKQFLGNDDFIELIKRKTKNISPLQPYDIEIEKIVEITANHLKIDPRLVFSRTKDRTGSFCRSVAGYLAHELCQHSITEIARYFGKEISVVSKGIKAVEEKLRTDKNFASSIKKLQRSLEKK